MWSVSSSFAPKTLQTFSVDLCLIFVSIPHILEVLEYHFFFLFGALRPESALAFLTFLYYNVAGKITRDYIILAIVFNVDKYNNREIGAAKYKNCSNFRCSAFF